MHFNLVTIFPELIDDFVSHGIISNAISKKKLSISTWNPREFSEDKNGRLDDKPYGGGPGMILQPDPIIKTVEAIKKKVMRGLSEPAGIITFPGVNGYTKELDKRLPYDVNAAKKLLADAGYPNGFEVELRCPNDRYVNDEAICTAVVGMLGKIGVNVSLNAQTKSKHFKELKDNQGDFYMLGWGVPTLDSHYVFHYLYETDASWNKVNFSNAEVDAAVRVMEGEVDLEKRNAAIAKAWKIVKDDIAYLPLHHQVISWASKRNVDVPIRPNNEPLFRFSNKR